MFSKNVFLLGSALLLAMPVGTLLQGCGGGGSSSSSNNSRTFNSALTIAPGQIAQLILSVQGDIASGKLIVPIQSARNKSAQAFTFAVPAGVFTFFGTFDAPTTFSVAGRIPEIGAFTVSGQIPGGVGANGSSGTYSLTARGETVTGSFAVASPTLTPTSGAN